MGHGWMIITLQLRWCQGVCWKVALCHDAWTNCAFRWKLIDLFVCEGYPSQGHSRPPALHLGPSEQSEARARWLQS